MKKVLVIGGTKGIGSAIKERLAEQGCQVETIARGSEASYVSDVADFSIDLPEIEGPLHGLVYCPGTVNLRPLRQISLDDFRKDWEINTLGAFRAVKTYLHNLQAADTASILFFSTVAVQVGMPFHASVASAKGGIEGLAKSLAAELCPKIRVNAIAPSLTDTPLVEDLLKGEGKRQTFSEKHPLKRIGSPQDMAAMAAFLLSEDAEWITGQLFHVDGGLSSLSR